MYIFYEEIIKRKCEVKVDKEELAEYESVEEYIVKNREYFGGHNYYDIYEEVISEPKNIEIEE